MSERIRCKRFFCRRLILVQTADEYGGLCGRCFKRKNPEVFSNEIRRNYQAQANIPVSGLTKRQMRSQLRVAIENKDVPRMDEILRHDTTVVSRPPDSTSTWLGTAISDGCDSIILNKLLAAGCAPNSSAKSGDTTPLDEAVEQDDTTAIQWLLQNGSNPNVGRPIIGAINFRKPASTQLEILSLLLDGGSNINQTFDLYGDESNCFTVLDWAELYGIPENVIAFLKSRGAKNNWTQEKILESKNDLKQQRIVQ